MHSFLLFFPFQKSANVWFSYGNSTKVPKGFKSKIRTSGCGFVPMKVYVQLLVLQEKRRAEIEEKLELAAAKDKEERTKQKKDLYEQRRKQQERIGFLANQVEMAETVGYILVVIQVIITCLK